MVRRLRRSFGCWVVLSVVSFLLVSVVAYGSGNVNWVTEFGVPLSGSMFGIDGSTVLSGGYNWADGFGVGGTIFLPLPDTAGGTLSVNAHTESDIVINWPVGTWGVNANAVFSLQTPSLSGFSSTANITAYGTSTTATFNLYQFRGTYATGLTLELAGPTQLGWGLSVTGAFGDSWGSPCNFDYTGTMIGLEAFPWGCVHTDVDFVFSTGGFEKVVIDLAIDPWDGILVLNGTLEFTLEEKTLNLTPYLTVGEECIWVSMGIEPQAIGPGTTNTIERLVFQGLGISDYDIGAVSFSMISSLGCGFYRSKGASDIDLHANGYYVALAPSANPKAWSQTDYTSIITLRSNAATFIGGFTSSQLTLDFYFGTSATSLFDFALFTAKWQHEMSEAFSYRIAVQLDPTGTKHRFEFGFTSSTALP